MLALALTLTLFGQPDDDVVAKARILFEAGQAAYSAGEYRTSAEAFQQAYDLLPNPAITFSIAQSYRLHYFIVSDPQYLRRAIDAYKRYLREVTSGGRRSDAVEHLASLEERLRRIEEKGGTVVIREEKQPTRLMVTATPESAVVAIDGSDPKPVPLTMEVKPGRHDVVISAPGHFERRVSVDVAEGALRVKDEDLKPMPANVDIVAPEGADVRVNGRLVGTAPLGAPLSLPAGKHAIVVTELGNHPKRTEVEVGLGESKKVEVELDTTWQRTLSWWFIGTGAAAFLGTGVVVAIALGSEGRARLLLRQLETEMVNLTPDELDTYRDARDRRNDLLAASTAGLATGVLFSAIGGLMYFLDEPDLGDVGIGTKVTVAPTIGTDAVGMSLIIR